MYALTKELDSKITTYEMNCHIIATDKMDEIKQATTKKDLKLGTFIKTKNKVF